MTIGPDSAVYGAIADPTRRRILRLLHETELSVSELAGSFPVTRPAISQHLAVLRQAGLVSYRQEGRTRYYQACAEPLGEIIDWLSYFDVFWDRKLAGLVRHMSEER